MPTNDNLRARINTLVVWLDTIINLFGCFVVVSLFLMLAVNDPKKKADADAQKQRPQELNFSIRWKPDGINADIDLWAIAPGDVAVGFASKQGRTLNLIRDNLGSSNTHGGLRFEEIVAFDVPAGPYCVNAAAYGAAPGLYPIRVTFDLQVRSLDTYQLMTTLVSGEIELTKTGEEITLACFTLDENRHVVPGTLNHLTHHLWSAARQ